MADVPPIAPLFRVNRRLPVRAWRTASTPHSSQGMPIGFIVFPTGPAGVALLLIRFSLVVALGGAIAWVDVEGAKIVAVIISGAILAGFRTRMAAAAAALFAAIVCVRVGGPLGLSAAIHGVCAVALSILGAGGYSVDAHLFGRKVIDLDR